MLNLFEKRKQRNHFEKRKQSQSSGERESVTAPLKTAEESTAEVSTEQNEPEKTGINDYAKETLSKKILRSIDEIDGFYFEVRIDKKNLESKFFKLDAYRKGTSVDTNLPITKLIAIFICAIIGGLIKIVY